MSDGRDEEPSSNAHGVVRVRFDYLVLDRECDDWKYWIMRCVRLSLTWISHD